MPEFNPDTETVVEIAELERLQGYELLFKEAIAARDQAQAQNDSALVLVRWARQNLLGSNVSPYEVLGQLEAILSQ